MRISDWSSDVCSSDLHQAVFKAPEAQAAVFAWDRDTEEAHFSELGPQGFGNIAALGIVLVGDRQDFAHREVARRFLNHTLFVGERSEEHTYELKSIMRHSSAVFCSTKKNSYSHY